MDGGAFPANARSSVDLRSDTVTRPTPEMYEAMQSAPLGDDVYGDDPTVKELEELMARMAGKEAAVFVPSGTMSNQIALATHCSPGDAVLVDEEAHIVYYEVGAPAAIAGVVTFTLPSVRGVLDPANVERHVLERSLHTPGTVLLCVENTHNRAGGVVTPLSTMAAFRDVANRHSMKVHLDGARAFNAAVALGVPLSQVTQHVDTVSICLSKGLRAPVGSLLCGPAEFIEKARLWRKRLGGGMRQAGILAACGIVSLTKMVDRLAEDHARARRMAEALDLLAGLTVDLESVQTNMVFVNSELPATQWQEEMAAEGVHFSPYGTHRFRLVFHADIGDEKVEQAIAAFQKVARTPVARR